MCDLAGTNSAAEVVFRVLFWGQVCARASSDLAVAAQGWEWGDFGLCLQHWGVVGHCGHAGYLTPAVEGSSGVKFKPSRM